MKHLLFGFLTLCLGFINAPNTQAQTNLNGPFTVLVSPLPRMVEKVDDETYVGFEIELWKEIAERLNLDYTFVEDDSFQSVLDKIRNRQADFALATVSIRSSRSEIMTFSQPYLNSGINVLVRDEEVNLMTYFSTLLSPLLIQTIGLYMLFCVLFGIIFWLLERGHNKDIQHHYWPGVMDGLWHAFKKPWSVEGHASRILVWPLWVITLLFSSIITAQVIERYDLKKENALFKENTNYADVRMGLMSESSADQRLSPRSEEFKQLFHADDIDQLYDALKNKEIDAIVGEQPLLLDIKSRAHEDGISVAIRPERLSEELYGIAISYGVDWRTIRNIDKHIMELRDNGFIRSLEQKWLSEETESKTTKVKLGSK